MGACLAAGRADIRYTQTSSALWLFVIVWDCLRLFEFVRHCKRLFEFFLERLLKTFSQQYCIFS